VPDVSIVTQLVGLDAVTGGLTRIQQGLTGLADSASSISSRLDAASASLTRVGATIGVATAPIALFGASALQAAGDFDSSMRQIQSVVQPTADQMERIRETAMRLGADTKFSANEAAQALLTLTQQGVPLEAAIGGVVEAAVNLASATGAPLASAATAASDAFLNFGRNAQVLPGYMDALLNAANASKFGLEDMMLAFSRAGAVAGSLNVPFNDVATLLALIASRYPDAGSAGTAFGYVLSGLNPSTERAKTAMEELGLWTERSGSAFYDAQGNLRPMPEVVNLLATAMGGLTLEQQQSYAQAIFSREAFGALNAIITEGQAGYVGLRDEVSQTGTAQAQAAAQMEGYNGAMEQLSGSLDGLRIAIANAGLIQWATDLVQAFTELVNDLAQLNPAFLQTATVIAAVAVAAGPVVLALAGIATVLATLMTGVGAAVVAVAALAAGLILFRDQVGAAVGPVIAYLADLFSTWDGTFSGLGPIVAQAMSDAAAALATLIPAVAQWGADFAAEIGAWVMAAGEALYVEVSSWDISGALGTLLDYVGQWGADFAATIGEWLMAAGEYLYAEVSSWDISGALGELLDYVAQWGADLAATIGEWLQASGEALYNEVTSWDISGALDELLDYVAEWGSELAATVSEWLQATGESLYAEIESWDILGSLMELVDDAATFGSEFAATIGEWFSTTAESAVAYVESMGDDIVTWFTGLPSRIASAGSSIIDAIQAPFIAAGNFLTFQSLVPDMVDSIAGQIGTLPGLILPHTEAARDAIVTPFEEAQAQVESTSASIAANIRDADWGIEEKAALFAQLTGELETLGTDGRDALEAVRAVIDATFNDELTAILSDTSLTLQEQQAAVEDLMTVYDGMDERVVSPTERARDALEAMREQAAAMADVMETEVNAVLDSSGLLMEEQVALLEAIIERYREQGIVAPEELQKVQDEVAALNTEIAAQNDVLAGVNAALVDNIEQWGGWGIAAQDIVEGFSSSAQSALSEFFVTGELDLDAFLADMQRVFADEAAETVIAFASGALRDFLGFTAGAKTETASVGTAITDMTVASAGTWTEWLGGLGTSFAGLFAEGGTLSSMLDGAISLFSGFFDGTEGGWGSWLAGLGDSLGGLFGEDGFLSGALDTAMGLFDGFFGEGSGGMTTMISDMFGSISGLFGEGGSLGGLVDTAMGLFDTFFGSGSGGTASMVTDMFGSLSGLFGEGGSMGGLLDTAVSLFNTFFGAGSGGTTSMVSSMFSTLSGLFGGGGSLSGLMTTANSLLGGFFTSGTAGGTGMVSSLSGMFSGLFGAGGTLSGLFSGGAASFAALFSNPVVLAGAAAAAAIGLAFVAFGGEFGDVMDGIRSVATSAFEAVRTVASAAVSAMQSAFSALGSALSTIFSAMRSAATAAFDAIRTAFSALTSAMEGALRALASAASAVFTTILGAARTAFSGILSAASSAFTAIGGALATLARAAATAFTTLLNAGVSAFNQLLTFAARAIGGIISLLGQLAGQLSGIFNLARDVFGQVLSLGQNLASELVDIFGNVAGQVRNILGDIGSTVGGLPKVILNWIGTIGSDLGKGDIEDLLQGIGGFLGNIPGLDSIVDGISDVFDDIGDIFSDIFDFFHTGGKVGGQGDVPIMAEGGEFVINKAATSEWEPLLKAINSGRLSVSDLQDAWGKGARAMEMPFKAFATGGDALLTSPTLLLGGEQGAERVSFRPVAGGTDTLQRPIVFNGPVVADDMSMNKFSRTLLRRLEKENRRLRG
jgi:TP901 family phage tail tape measure protein